MENENKETEINLIEVLMSFLKKWWIIAITSVLFAFVVFVYLFKFTPQEYKASVRLYVNNSSLSLGGSSISISSSDISANRSLVDSYAVILTSNSTLEAIFDKANIMDEEDISRPKYKTKLGKNGNFEYDYDYLRTLISVSAVDNTEIFSVSFTCDDAADAVTLANTVLDIFPNLVKEIIEGTSAKTVDNAKYAVDVEKGYAKYCIIAFLVGAVLSCGVIFVYDFFINDNITSSDYITQTYNSIPLLAIIPDSSVEPKAKYSKYGKYYYYKHRYDYYSDYYKNDEEEK